MIFNKLDNIWVLDEEYWLTIASDKILNISTFSEIIKIKRGGLDKIDKKFENVLCILGDNNSLEYKHTIINLLSLENV